jgi:hypothetical protein
MSNSVVYEDPIVEEMRIKIQREEDRLSDLEDRLAECEDGDHDYHQQISDQQDYLAGLHEGFNRMLIKRGLL